MINYIETFLKIAPIIAATDYGIGKLTSILLWIARAVVISVGGAVGIIKSVKGKSDENPKEMNEGLVIIASAGVIFAATFAIEAIFS